MVKVFGDYARYYNLLYQDKDYAGETEFVLKILEDAGNSPSSVLDLGCGTGRHALEMARRGLEVIGVDSADTMIQIAQSHLNSPSGNVISPHPHFVSGDARSVRLGRSFDAVTSLFHVMSYQLDEHDALGVLSTARSHLTDYGYFLFDFWYGPGVLSDPPKSREKTMHDDTTHVLRKAQPFLDVNTNTVDVRYDVFMTDNVLETVSELTETHRMRYWFIPELRYLAREAGFYGSVQVGVWPGWDVPTRDTWTAWMLVGV